MISFRSVVFVFAALACFFPYTQLVNSDSYTQPYALILAALVVALFYKRARPAIATFDGLTLMGLGVVGLCIFLASCLPSAESQDYKSLLMYLSPFAFSASTYIIAKTHPQLLRRVAFFSVVIWLVVGWIQTLFLPTFMTWTVGGWSDAAEVVVASGRGVLGLAPEPTHHGFHLLLLAAILICLDGNKKLAFACVLSALLVAKSASALLAVLLGFLVMAVTNPTRWSGVLLALGVLVAVAPQFVESVVFYDGTRLIRLVVYAISNPMEVLAFDHSINGRLGGILVGAELVMTNAFLPHGMSNSEWVGTIPRILERYNWLYDISAAGIPSGLVILLYQIGFFAVFLLVPIIRRVVSVPRTSFEMWILMSALTVFLFQYLISNPLFGVLHGISVAKAHHLLTQGRLS